MPSMRRFTWSIVVVFAAALPAGCAQTPPDAASAGPNTPGWTGRTVVVGSNSSINDDLQATYWSQKWGIGRQR
jgi:type IV pilus biogenesis protein CpaD/CtpE